MAGIEALPRRRRVVRDLLSVGSTDSNAVEIVVQSLRNNNAAPVAEGGTKPESDLGFNILTVPVRTLAHWTKMTTQALSDIPSLRSMVDDDLIQGLLEVEEQQILSGDNTGQNLNGIIPQATAYVAPVAISDPNLLDSIALAALQIATNFYFANGVILNPADLLQARLLKNSLGDYILG